MSGSVHTSKRVPTLYSMLSESGQMGDRKVGVQRGADGADQARFEA